MLHASGDLPDPAVDIKADGKKHTVVLAGGCFWCTEAVFQIVEGVDGVLSGYAGGTKETAPIVRDADSSGMGTPGWWRRRIRFSGSASGESTTDGTRRGRSG